MQLYVDTSALVKLIVVEAESSALRSYLAELRPMSECPPHWLERNWFGPLRAHRSIDVLEHARRVLARMHLVTLSNRLLDAAATMAPRELRTLDAIHLAAALTAPDLRAMVTYDSRLAEAAAAAGIAVVSPR